MRLIFILASFSILISTFGQQKNSWKVDITTDYKIDITNQWTSNDEEITLRIYSNRSVYIKKIELIEDKTRTLFFPKDFKRIRGDSISARTPQQLTLEIYNEKKKEFVKLFYFDPSPNGALQLNPYFLEDGFEEENTIWGNVIDAYQWVDKLRNNIFIRSEITPFFGKQLNDKTKYIYCYHFEKLPNNEYKLIRKFSDVVSSCADSIVAEFYLPTIELTDVNRDTIGEISLLYQVECIPFVSNLDLNYKLLFTTNGEKYMLYGKEDTQKANNTYTLSSGVKLNEVYERFMVKKWNKFISK